MSQDNKVEKLIINQLTKEQYKNLTNKSKTEIYDITDEEHYTADEMQSLLDKKQDKLTAGKGLEITSDNVINNTQTSAEWGNITGDIATQTDLKSALDLKANDNNVVHISTDETINDIKTFSDKTIFNGGTGGVTNSPSIEVKNHIITGGTDVTTWSGIQSNRKCTNDNNLINTASLIINSDGTTKISHKRGTETEIGVGEDAYLTLDAEKLVYAKSDIKGNSSTTEYEVYHSGNLVAGDNVILDKINGVTAIDVNIPTVLTDDTTIIKDSQDTISAIGVKTKSNGILYEWIGTQAEYDTDFASGKITTNTECLITDDEQELIGTVDLNIPTKLSELANDTHFTTQDEVTTLISKIETERLIQNRIYDGIDLTVKFANEISLFSDEWAWIKDRINRGDYSGLYIGDYIPVTISSGTAGTTTITSQTFKCQIAGIDTYTNCCDTNIGHHIDFISKECVDSTIQWCTTNNNNGTSVENNPWLSSIVYAWLNGVNNLTTSSYNNVSHGLNADNKGIYQLLPTKLKNQIVNKKQLLDSRYSASDLLTAGTGWYWEDMGNLWLPNEFEIYGTQVRGNIGQVTSWWNPEANMGIAYPLYLGNGRNRVKYNSLGDRVTWWLSSVDSYGSSNVCSVYSYGNALSCNASGVFCCPLCFRI